MMDGMMEGGAPAPEAGEQESTATCPNCGCPLKIEAEQQAEPSVRDSLMQAMDAQQAAPGQ